MGVQDEVTEVPGVTTAMLVAFGENDIKTVEDVAGCVTDDLIGWYEHVDGERTRMDGILDGFDLGAEEAQAMIMAARVKAGWVTEEELAEVAAAEAAEAEAEEQEENGEAAEGEAAPEAEA